MEMMFTKASIVMVNGKAVVAARMPMVLNTTAYLLVVFAKDTANTETATVWMTKVNGFPIIDFLVVLCTMVY